MRAWDRYKITITAATAALALGVALEVARYVQRGVL